MQGQTKYIHCLTGTLTPSSEKSQAAAELFPLVFSLELVSHCSPTGICWRRKDNSTKRMHSLFLHKTVNQLKCNLAEGKHLVSEAQFVQISRGS